MRSARIDPLPESVTSQSRDVKEVLVMKLSPRFVLDNLFVVGGAFLAVVAMAFTASVAGWIGFGVFTGLTVLAFVSAVVARATGQKIGHTILGLVGLWSLVAALAFSGTVLTWLVFADAIALGVIALADLTAHEVTTESVVHRLVITETPVASESGRAAA
jgi:hypothetical protein